jgi:hypothetical protein
MVTISESSFCRGLDFPAPGGIIWPDISGGYHAEETFAHRLLALLWQSCGTKEDNPGEVTQTRYACDGPLSQCLKIKSGWTFEGMISDKIIVDPSVVSLADGRFRIYGNDTSEGTRHVISLISDDGLKYTREPGYRIVSDSGHDAFAPNVIVLPNGQFRMYLTDQRTHIGDQGAPAFISAISDDGLNFTWEPGERLRYSGAGNEVGGIRNPCVVRLPSGKYRMYYVGLPTQTTMSSKVLSASSWDGLTWTRENGVRLDPATLCPPATRINPKMYLDESGVYHMFTSAAACDDMNHSKEAIGIFEGTSQDGVSFSFSRTAVVQGYYIKSQYHENPEDPFVNPEDPMLVLTPAGFRMYFNCPKSGTSASDARYHSVVNPTLH